MWPNGVVITCHSTIAILIYVASQSAITYIQKRFWCVLRIITPVPLRIPQRTIVREKVDIIPAVERSVPSMQSFGRF